MHTDMGHRQRVKERFLREGLENFDEVHMLELLLFYVIPRKDTKPIARELLDRFGSLAMVLEATPEELQTVPNIGKQTPGFLSLILQAARYYQVRRTDNPVILDTVQKYGDYLKEHLFGRRNETVFLLCLDAKSKVLCCRKVGEGDVNSANIPVRRMAEIALGVNATAAILAHNHPSGVAVPSVEDRVTTERLAKCLGAMDIVLLDHIVVADDDYVSMTQSRLYDPREFCSL